MKYIVQLSEEIQAMEGGDLDHPITVQGSDELTTLASSLELHASHPSAASTRTRRQAAAKVKNLITEMQPRSPYAPDHPAALHRDPPPPQI